MFKLKKKVVHSAVQDDIIRIVDDNTPFAISESFRMLHANVQYLPIVDKCKKIAITSAVSGEGKTYIALNLSITLATNSDKKVLLVDMDMRAPRIKRLIKSKVVRAKKFTGLSEYLAGIDKEPNILNTDIPNFDVLFSGKESSNSIGLINSPKIVTLFEELSEKYDYIIIDTPPVNIVTDALLLSGKINGYILSTRSNYSNINSLNIAIENIKSVGGEIFGLVLTELNVKSAKNTKYNYPIGDYN